MHKNRPLKPLISLLFLQFFGHEKQTNAQGLLMYVICFVPIPVHLRECLNLTRKSSKNSFHSFKGLFRLLPPSCIGHDARIASSSTRRISLKNPI